MQQNVSKYLLEREPKDTEFVDYKPCLLRDIIIGPCTADSFCPHQHYVVSLLNISLLLVQSGIWLWF